MLPMLFRSFNKCCFEDVLLVDANVTNALVKRKRKYKFVNFEQLSTIMSILKVLRSLVFKVVIQGHCIFVVGTKFIFYEGTTDQPILTTDIS